MINIERIDRSEALRYLAFKGQEIPPETDAYMDECESRILKIITPKFLFKYFPVVRCEDTLSLDGTRLVLEGKDIRSHLEGCTGAVLMAATVGSGTDMLLRQLMIEDMAKAVIADAFMSACIEQVCNEGENIIKNDLAGKYFTWRFSPGYGDFPLDVQKKLLDVLDAPKRIGLCVMDSGLLTPVKSVTAVIGVSDAPLPRRVRGCAGCDLRDTCIYRKKGIHCGN